MPYVSADEFFRKIPPSGIALKAPATESQRKLLTDAGYRLMTEAEIKALGIRDFPYKENVWWQIRNPDLIPREALYPEEVSDPKGISTVPANREEQTREELDIDLER